MKIDDRLRRLEDAAASEHDRAAAQVADAAAVTSIVECLASRFPDSAASMTLAERVTKMSLAEHCAWDMRFGQIPTPFATIMALHGVPIASPSSEIHHAHC
jgi:hypothetical protein